MPLGLSAPISQALTWPRTCPLTAPSHDCSKGGVLASGGVRLYVVTMLARGVGHEAAPHVARLRSYRHSRVRVRERRTLIRYIVGWPICTRQEGMFEPDHKT